jgi:alpha-1,4-digalacturonate transport system substrate-binding protein
MRSTPPARRPVRWRGLAAAAGALLVSAAAACSSASSSAPGTPAAPSGTVSAGNGFAGQSITYLYFTNGPDLNATKTLISRFQTQTGATVTLDTVPYANLNETIQAQVSAGKPPAVVETSAPGIFESDLVNLGQALGSAWVKTLNPNLLTGGELNGQVIGLPNQLTVMAPMVNVTMFQKAGVPVPTINSKWTWAQLVADAEKVQAANHTPFAIAIDHSGDRVANVFAQYGTYLFGANGTGTWDTQAATNAMTEVTGLISSNEISKASWIAGGEKYVAGDTEFLGEQAPVLLSGSWEVASFSTSVPFKWAAVPNPCDVNCGGGSGGNYMVAFKNSNDPKLAEAFIKFMSEPANQAYMSEVSDTVPSSQSLAAPGSITYSAAIAPNMNVFNKEATLMPGAFTLSESNPGYTATAQTLVDEITDVVAGKATVAQAVAAVAASAAMNNGKS